MRENRIQRTEKENIVLKIMISSFIKHSSLTPNRYTLFSCLRLTADNRLPFTVYLFNIGNFELGIGHWEAKRYLTVFICGF